MLMASLYAPEELFHFFWGRTCQKFLTIIVIMKNLTNEGPLIEDMVLGLILERA